MIRPVVVATLLAVFALGACADDGSTATAPTTSPPTVAGHRALGHSGDGRVLTEGDAKAVIVSRDPDGSTASPAQRAAARRFADATRAGAEVLPTVADAERAGYRQIDPDHWVNAAFLDDGRVADPAAIESLVYRDVDGTRVLTGAMYIAPGNSHGPQVAGPLTAWHFHRYRPRVCTIAGSFPVGAVAADGTCARGAPADRSPEMLHVWFDGRADEFSERMSGPDHVHGAEPTAEVLAP